MTDDPLRGRRVLVVEDEIFVAMMLEGMLDELGCEVVGPVAGVAQALAIIHAAGPIDAAVLDVNLNGQKSYPVADALAARGVPFVFSTGYRKEALSNGHGGVPVLQKPFRLSELGGALEGLLTHDAGGIPQSS